VTPTRKVVIPIVSGAAAVRVYQGHEESCPRADFAGSTLAMRQVPGFRLIENQYPSGLELSRHFHEKACLTYVIEGSYSESHGAGSSVLRQPGGLHFLPAGQKHSNIFKENTRCLIVEIEREALQRVEKHSKGLDRPGEIRGMASTWLAQRLDQEFHQGDPLSLMSLEGILLEILADGARNAGATGPVKVVPRWLRIAREYLESNFLRPLSLSEVAAVASVHRVHLSREFRRHFSTTVGEFLRKKRVEHACHLVSRTNESLADVAMTCGFSDQSHFSATFRRQVGLTPGRFRQMAQSR